VILGPSEIKVLVATKPVDFRKQGDTLAALVQEALGADPFSGTVFVFRAKRADRVKLLWWDGTGICLLTKRLEGGQFRWPRIEDGVMRLTAAQLAALLEGLEWGGAERLAIEAPRAAS
jgi:transposase